MLSKEDNELLTRTGPGAPMGELERLLYEDTGVIPNMFTVVVNARAGSLQGPKVRLTPEAANGVLDTHLWEWTR